MQFFVKAAQGGIETNSHSAVSIPLIHKEASFSKNVNGYFSCGVFFDWNIRKTWNFRAGRLCQGAPARRTQRIPFSTARASRQGRPRPSGRRLGVSKGLRGLPLRLGQVHAFDLRQLAKLTSSTPFACVMS